MRDNLLTLSVQQHYIGSPKSSCSAKSWNSSKVMSLGTQDKSVGNGPTRSRAEACSCKHNDVFGMV